MKVSTLFSAQHNEIPVKFKNIIMDSIVIIAVAALILLVVVGRRTHGHRRSAAR